MTLNTDSVKIELEFFHKNLNFVNKIMKKHE